MTKPRVAISMGDPGGVGPEIIVRALSDSDVRNQLDPVVFGDLEWIRTAARTVGLPLTFHAADSNDPSTPPERHFPSIPVVQPDTPCSGFVVGEVSPANGSAAYNFIISATRAVLEKRCDALCTAPISKEAMYLSGCHFPGHTELLASLCGLTNVRMMLCGGGIQAVLQTIHVPITEVPALITHQALLDSLQIIHRWAAGFGAPRPSIAVCGLNPHAGENGHIGREELDIIGPAIEEAKQLDIHASGPWPADTIFFRAIQGEFDFVLAMYHDQALIPVKTLDFHGGINTTLGLPIIRTSPDHGTAFNIAGRNQANPGSMIAALKMAADLATRRTASL